MECLTYERFKIGHQLLKHTPSPNTQKKYAGPCMYDAPNTHTALSREHLRCA